ncbi:cycloeucalenol cycloisomerase [Hordeum vulgare]|nr:cycloeucalenol cycloisomerase [Hordeum vulgare]
MVPSQPDAAARRGPAGKGKRSAWLAADGSKRWGEAFFLLYTPFWLTLCLGLVVPFKLYERFTELEYLVIGLVSTVPAFLIPLFIVGKAIAAILAAKDKDDEWKRIREEQREKFIDLVGSDEED